ncbi:MAG: DUF3237 domain-containing protein [Sphingomonadales bacterium]|nr:DUF3237 domain-containing protein [Sphingomonadales bacterium]MDE2568710.1 DUF3237 domain-containing protein [Sphingomonadales bacterium]
MKKIAALAMVLALAAPARAAEPGLAFAFEETVTLAPDVHPGATALGERNIVPITGGTFEGPGIKGTIIGGGWDWQLRRADGCTQIKADYMLRTDDDVVINVVNTGVSCRARDPAAVVRTHPVFEAPLGKYEWLSQSAFIGTLDPVKLPGGQRAVHITFYRVT